MLKFIKLCDSVYNSRAQLVLHVEHIVHICLICRTHFTHLSYKSYTLLHILAKHDIPTKKQCNINEYTWLIKYIIIITFVYSANIFFK